jgi:hypothetical protein
MRITSGALGGVVWCHEERAAAEQRRDPSPPPLPPSPLPSPLLTGGEANRPVVLVGRVARPRRDEIVPSFFLPLYY